MRKTTFTDNPGTADRSKPSVGSFRYFMAIVPFVLVLLISTSYQQNHNDVNYFRKNDFAPEVKDSLNRFFKSVSTENLLFKTGIEEWKFIKDFYSKIGYRPIWIHLKGLDERAEQLILLIGQAREFGLEPFNYHHSVIKELVSFYRNRSTESNRIYMDFNLEIALTDAAFRLMFNLHSGYLPVDTAFKSGMATEFSEILMDAIADNDVRNNIISVEPNFSEYKNLRHAVSVFAKANSLTNPDLKISYTDTARLGDISRYRTLALNLDRLRKNKYNAVRMLYVNIPSYSLRIFENNQIADTFRIIVGTPSSPTPVMTGNMETIIANPVWYVPKSIAIGEILPKIQSDSTYLERNRFSILDRNYNVVQARDVKLENIKDDEFDYTFRQERGADNSLGKAKFLFNNPYSVYLHDTPSRALFSKDKRAFSHGCIRIQHPERLAKYILNKINNDTTDFASLMNKGIHCEFKLTSSLPVYITYLTCDATADGSINFYDDIYEADDKELRELAPYMNK